MNEVVLTNSKSPDFLSAEAETSIPARFEKIAAQFPSRIAIGSGDWQPAYEELNMAANRLARMLISRGEPADRTAILLRHDSPLLAAILAVLKAGRIVVVLNPADPPARLAQILAEADARVLLTDAANRNLAEAISGKNQNIVCFEESSTDAAENPELKIAPDAAAFIIFTSGSTGRPKGVIQTHRNILHNVARLSQGMCLQKEDRITLLASPGSGQGLSTMWCALLNGAALCPFPVLERGAAPLMDWVAACDITVFISSASLLRSFLKSLAPGTFFPRARLVRLGSESVEAADFQLFREHFSAGCVLLNSLSSSETGNIAQHRLTQSENVVAGRLSVGWPVTGMEIILLDENGREIHNGETGEIVVRSRYLSPGYWRNESLTAERFSENGDGQRVFRSGDLGRRLENGALIFMGRKDALVKIHGYRVELSEIEIALQQLPEIEAAIVLTQTENDEVRLVAHVVRHVAKNLSSEDLRRALRQTLPGHMIPAHFIFHETFPLTPGGKINREKLRQMPLPVLPFSPDDAPKNETEILLAGIWQKVFNRDFIGRRDDFFDLGGDSLNATIVAAEIAAARGVELELRVFTEHSTLAGLADLIDRLPHGDDGKKSPPWIRVSRNAPQPFSFTQERTWRYSQTPSGILSYTMTACYRLRGAPDVEALRESLDFLFHRHEILRATISETEGQPVQIIQPPKTISLPLLDFTGAPDAEEKARNWLSAEARRGFDFQRGPLVRFALARIRTNEHWLLRVSHHFISDAPSWKIFFRELNLIYAAKLKNQTPPLPDFEPWQYLDYAARQRNLLHPDGAAYREIVDWWTKLFSRKLRPAKLPFRRLWRNRRASPADGTILWGLNPQTSRRLDEISREKKTTPFLIRAAAFAALLSAKDERDDLIFGTYMTNRHCVKTQNMFGDFADTAPVCLRCRHAQTFYDWLAVVKKAISETQLHSEIPYELLGNELKKSGVTLPKFQAIFDVTYQNALVQIGDLEVTRLELPPQNMPWGFSLRFDPYDEEHCCRLTFDASLYHPARVRKWLAQFINLLDAVSEHPDWIVGKLLAAAENNFTKR